MYIKQFLVGKVCLFVNNYWLEA